MIEKERIIPRIILILQALLRRLPLNHPKLHMITEELGKRMAGFKGGEGSRLHFKLFRPQKILHPPRSQNPLQRQLFSNRHSTHHNQIHPQYRNQIPRWHCLFRPYLQSTYSNKRWY